MPPIQPLPYPRRRVDGKQQIGGFSSSFFFFLSFCLVTGDRRTERRKKKIKTMKDWEATLYMSGNRRFGDETFSRIHGFARAN